MFENWLGTKEELENTSYVRGVFVSMALMAIAVPLLIVFLAAMTQGCTPSA